MPRIFEISGSRRPFARNTRNAGAVRMNGWSGMRSAIVAWSALLTITMSACCRSLLLGADSAQAHRSRSSSGIDRAIRIAPMHPAAGEAGELVEAGQILIDRERFAEASLAGRR